MTDKEITIANLKIAYKKLIEFAAYYPEIERDFNMRKYGCYEYLHKSTPVCNTVGCLLGNIGRAFKHESSDYMQALGFDYGFFGRRIFPALYHLWSDLHGLEWRYLFASDWAEIQPTFKQALTRMKKLIDSNLELTKAMRAEMLWWC
ncbi:hypothetical protein GCM10027051_31470 [Niabella terrae]